MKDSTQRLPVGRGSPTGTRSLLRSLSSPVRFGWKDSYTNIYAIPTQFGVRSGYGYSFGFYRYRSSYTEITERAPLPESSACMV